MTANVLHSELVRITAYSVQTQGIKKVLWPQDQYDMLSTGEQQSRFIYRHLPPVNRLALSTFEGQGEQEEYITVGSYALDLLANI